MSFDAGSIMGRVGLNVSPFAQSMLEAGSIARSFPPIVQSFIANPLLAVVDIARGVGNALSGAFREATNFADDMGDLAQSVGVGVEALTALGLAAQQSGANIEEVAGGYRFLGRAVAEAMESADSAAAKTFANLGVTLLNADGSTRAMEDVMLDVADALARLPEGAQRTAAAMELLGRGGTALLPTLLQGSTALREQMEQMRRYGVAVTQQSRDSADRWNDAMGEMGLAFRGLRMAIAEPIRDALLPVLERTLEWVRENQPQIREMIVTTVEVVVGAFARVSDAIAFAQRNADALLVSASALGGFLGGAAFLGVLIQLAPLFLGLVNPIRAVGLAMSFLLATVSPMQLALRVVGAGIAALAVYAARNPEVMAAVRAAADQLTAAMGALWGVVETQVIPVIGDALQQALAWIAPKMPAIRAAIADVWQQVQGFASYVLATAVPIVQDTFSAAWDTLNTAIDSAWPYIQRVGDVLGEVVDWIVSTAAPSIGGFFAEMWAAAEPVIDGLSAIFVDIWEAVLKPLFGWIVETAAPAIGTALAKMHETSEPIFKGTQSLLNGLWDTMKAVLSWFEPVAKSVGDQIRTFAGVVSWVWTNALQPVIAWVWSAVSPALDWVGKTVGWLLDQVGKLMSWLGQSLKLTDDVAESSKRLPRPQAPVNAGAEAAAAAGRAAAGLAASASGPPVINANVPAVDETKLAKAISAELDPRVEENIRAAGNAAKAARYAQRVGRSL